MESSAPMTREERFGERVRKARRNAGYTQASAAKALGCTERTISNWEREPGTTNPSPALFLQFADLVGSSTSWLYDGEEPNERRADPRDADRGRQQQADE